MQDRYTGDVGDFGKFALLRALSADRRLGVCWCRTDGAGEANNDGKHLGYLERPGRFRPLDPTVFDALQRFAEEVREGRRARTLDALEALGLLPGGTLFHRDLCPPAPQARREWARRMVSAMADADLVFLDPDNGLESERLTPKSTAVAELSALRRPGRAILFYHHQSRLAGGAPAEFAAIAQRLAASGFVTVDAARLRPYSSRFYFLLDGDASLRQRLKEFVVRWSLEAVLYSSDGDAPRPPAR